MCTTRMVLGDACSYPIETGCDMGPAKILLGASPYNQNDLIKGGGMDVAPHRGFLLMGWGRQEGKE